MSFRMTINPGVHEGTHLVRVLNEQTVLEIILNNGEITRPAIARKTGLSLPTIASLVESMERIGLIREQRMVSGEVGRPATLYSANPNAGYVFAVDLGGIEIRAGITNLVGEVISESVEQTNGGNPSVLMDKFARLYRRLLQKSGFEKNTVGVACVGVPGVWNSKTDKIDAAYNLPMLNEIPLRATIQQVLDLPLIIENDVNLAAIGESWKGVAQDYDTFVTFSIGTGIGMGIVIDGEVYRGKNGAAGEIGLLPIGPDPFHPSLRSHGPLEIAASEPSIVTRLQCALAGDEESVLTPDANISQIIEAGDNGDEIACTILDDEARVLAIGVAAIVAVLDPPLLILSGGVGAHDELAQLVHRYAAQLIPWMPPIEVSVLGNRAAFYGAIALGLQALRKQVLVETRSRIRLNQITSQP